MTSRIRLYTIPEMLEENNYILESITDFLGAFSPDRDIFKFQYQRLESVKNIKINQSQTMDNPMPPFMSNYCRIDTYADDGETPIAGMSPAFYYIEGIEQESKNTIRLYLKLDVLNTYYDQFKSKMTNATYILRGHEDRFKPFLLSDVERTLQLVSIFNRVPEGDNFPLRQLEGMRETIYDIRGGDSEASPLKFYLVYRTANDGRPCIDLCANRELLLSGADEGGEAVEMKASEMVNGRYYYMLGDFTFQYEYMEDTGQGTEIPTWSLPYFVTNGIMQFQKSGTDLIIRCVYGSTTLILTSDVSDGIIRIVKGRRVYYSNVATFDSGAISQFPYATINAGDYPAKYLGNIEQLDKTAQSLVKVIECPYCPISYTFNSSTGIYTFNRALFDSESEAEYPKYLRTYQLGKELPKVQIGRLADWNDYLVQEGPASAIENLATSPAPAFLVDPKIYTSQYMAITLVYDSFAKQIKFEDFQHTGQNYYGHNHLQFLFKQSANVSSALMFELRTSDEIDPEGGFVLTKAEENYPRIMTASRNNELALFSSAYLDYLKNGYNYDKKKREENLQFQGGMSLLQTLGSLLSFALAPATGGISAAAGASLAVGAATSYANMGRAVMQSGEELNQKINLLKAQSYAVSSIDDLDLFNEYGKNKLQLVKYSVEGHNLNQIKTRFQYFGYAVEKYSNPYPFYFNGRHNFNFLKCEPVFVQSVSRAIPMDYLNEIADKLRGGVTVWHKRFYVYNNYELNRDCENIEESILAEI